MATIRPLARDDLKAVAGLARTGLPGWNRDPDVLARNLIDHPWAGESSRSLVAVDDEAGVVGSIGAQVRRMRFDRRSLEAVCVSHLVVAHDHRGGASGALLVRELLAGDQELTFTDSGTPEVVRIWRAFGAHLDHSRACDWMIVLRPGRWLRAISSAGFSRQRSVGRRSAPVGALPFHVARRQASRPASQPSSEITAEDASPTELAETIQAICRAFRLHVDYEPVYLEYLFSYLAYLKADGNLVCRVVRRRGTPVGWYAYFARDVTSRVLHIGASVREAEAVVDEMVNDARRRGTAALSGRLEPHLDEAVRRQGAVLGFAERPLVHAREPDVIATVQGSSALLTELDLIDTVWW